MIVIASTRKLTLAHLARSPNSRVRWLLLRPVIWKDAWLHSGTGTQTVLYCA